MAEPEREQLIGKLSDCMDPDNARDFVDRVIQEARPDNGGVGSVADYIAFLADQRAELLDALKAVEREATSFTNLARQRGEDLRPEAADGVRNALATARAAIAKAEG
jgi:hypothetical protein